MNSPSPLTLDSPAAVARLLDHAILHPTVTPAAVLAEVDRIAPLGVASLCVRPADVRAVAERLERSPVGVGTVIGFPHGCTSTAAKVAESQQALGDGAVELDMVIQIGPALGHDWAIVRGDIAAVLQVARAGNALLKVIFETDFFPDDAEKIRLCEICGELGADFVKTSTGFGYVRQTDGSARYVGATDHDVRLMRKHSPASVGVKPSGGVRSLADVQRFVALGATRIGTGSAATIMDQAHAHFEGASVEHSAPRGGDRQHQY